MSKRELPRGWERPAPDLHPNEWEFLGPKGGIWAMIGKRFNQSTGCCHGWHATLWAGDDLGHHATLSEAKRAVEVQLFRAGKLHALSARETPDV